MGRISNVVQNFTHALCKRGGGVNEKSLKLGPYAKTSTPNPVEPGTDRVIPSGWKPDSSMVPPAPEPAKRNPYSSNIALMWPGRPSGGVLSASAADPRYPHGQVVDHFFQRGSGEIAQRRETFKAMLSDAVRGAAHGYDAEQRASDLKRLTLALSVATNRGAFKVLWSYSQSCSLR